MTARLIDHLRAIEARAEAAPKGPYWASTKADGDALNNGNVLRRDESGDMCVILQANHYFQPTFPLLDFVAQARADIPALVAEVRRLRGQVDALALLVPEVFNEAYWCCEYDSHGCKSTYQDSYWKESESLKNLTAILTPTNNANGAESEGE